MYFRKLREKHESERQAKLRLQKRLDALRPSASVSGRQKTAETTPTVFDLVGCTNKLFFNYKYSLES